MNNANNEHTQHTLTVQFKKKLYESTGCIVSRTFREKNKDEIKLTMAFEWEKNIDGTTFEFFILLKIPK